MRLPEKIAAASVGFRFSIDIPNVLARLSLSFINVGLATGVGLVFT
jgi:hypothetical protein